MSFEDYLRGKKIDSDAFRTNEPVLWESWKVEFEQMHPNSFTVQKLNLINPVRRKYPGKITVPETTQQTDKPATSASTTPKVTKPVFRPKPKMG